MDVIPFNRPYVGRHATEHLQRCLAAGRLSGDGPYAKWVETRCAELMGAGRYFLTPSGTAALELACQLIEIEPGDEILIPSYNFTSAALAVLSVGAKPVFVDTDPLSLESSLEHYQAARSPRTRALISLHYAGLESHAGAIKDWSDGLGLFHIQDCAHAFGANGEQVPLSSYGDLAAFSFHETKNIQCGEGGLLRINNQRLVERAEILREKGTNRSRFFRGEVDKYTWVDRGSSWLLAEPLAAMLVGQLEEYEWIQSQRQNVWRCYQEELTEFGSASGWHVLGPTSAASSAAHIFPLVLPSLADRTRFIEVLRQRNVSSVFHYQALHSSEAGRRWGVATEPLPGALKLSDALVRLPIYPELQDSQIEQVIEACRAASYEMR